MKLMLACIFGLMCLEVFSVSARPMNPHAFNNLKRFTERLKHYLKGAQAEIKKLKGQNKELLECCARINGVCYKKGDSFNTTDGCHTCTCSGSSLACTPVEGACLEEKEEVTLCEDGSYFPDPEDCNKYFQCDHGKRVHRACEVWLHFNPTINVCDYRDKAGCE